jgi:hypothetical protein
VFNKSGTQRLQWFDCGFSTCTCASAAMKVRSQCVCCFDSAYLAPLPPGPLCLLSGPSSVVQSTPAAAQQQQQNTTRALRPLFSRLTSSSSWRGSSGCTSTAMAWGCGHACCTCSLCAATVCLQAHACSAPPEQAASPEVFELVCKPG